MGSFYNTFFVLPRQLYDCILYTGRISHIFSVLYFLLVKFFPISADSSLYGHIIRGIGLNNNLSSVFSSAGPSCHLGYKLISSFRGIIFTRIERHIRSQHAHKRHIFKVVALCYHLGAYKYICSSVSKFFENVHISVFTAYGIRVHS